MGVHKCARCGKYISQDAQNFFLRKPRRWGVYRFGKKAYLCQECARSFYYWFFNPEVKEENNEQS